VLTYLKGNKTAHKMPFYNSGLIVVTPLKFESFCILITYCVLDGYFEGGF